MFIRSAPAFCHLTQSTTYLRHMSHIAFKEMIFLLSHCFDLVVNPRGVLVITDYILIWNEIMRNIKYGFIEEV